MFLQKFGTWRQSSKRFTAYIFARNPITCASLAIIFNLSYMQAALAQSANDSGAAQDNFGSAFNELKRNDNLQFEFTASPPPSDPPRWLEIVAEFFGSIFNGLGNIISMLSPLFTMAFWLGVGALIMAILYLLGTTLLAARLGGGKKKPEAAAPALYQPEQAQARVLLAEIDALAAQGKYAEAVHTLLFRSIQDIDLNHPNVIRRSLTSREIGGLKILTAQSREVFSNIASIVERSFFGRQDIGEPDFDMARTSYMRLTGQSGGASEHWTSQNNSNAAS